jgi:chromosome segregation ATPase
VIPTPPTSGDPGTETASEPTPAKDTDDIAELRRLLVEKEKAAKKANDESAARRRSLTLTERERDEAKGNIEALKASFEAESTELRTERDTLKIQSESLEKELTAAREEVKGFKETILSKFEEADRALAKDLTISAALALYERLYSKPLLPPAAVTSPNPNNPAGKPPAINTNGLSANEKIRRAYGG